MDIHTTTVDAAQAAQSRDLAERYTVADEEADEFEAAATHSSHALRDYRQRIQQQADQIRLVAQMASDAVGRAMRDADRLHVDAARDHLESACRTLAAACELGIVGD